MKYGKLERFQEMLGDFKEELEEEGIKANFTIGSPSVNVAPTSKSFQKAQMIGFLVAAMDAASDSVTGHVDVDVVFSYEALNFIKDTCWRVADLARNLMSDMSDQIESDREKAVSVPVERDDPESVEVEI